MLSLARFRLIPLLSLLLLLSFALLLATNAQAADKPPVVRVGIMLDGPGERDQELIDLFKEEIWKIAGHEFDVQFPKEKIISGDWTNAGIDVKVGTMLRDPDVDVLLVLGFVASQRFCCRIDVRKPVVAAFVLDHEVQNLPKEGAGTGRPFLNYVSSPAPIESDLSVFRDLAGFDKLTVLIGQPFIDSVPDLEKHFLAAVKSLKLEIRIVPVELSADDVLGALRSSTQAVYLGPLLNLPPSEFNKLVDGLKERNLPSFSLTGCDEVDVGVLGSLRPRDQVVHRARQTAVNMVRILRGEDAGDIPIEFMLGERLCVNAETAKSLGIKLDERVAEKAEIISAVKK